MAIAVFDEYVTRGYQGKMLITISDEGITESFIWDVKGEIQSLLGSE